MVLARVASSMGAAGPKPTASESAMEDRYEIITLSRAGWSAAAIARQLGIGERTVTRWRTRYRTAGSAGLVSRSSRPHTAHPATTPAPVLDCIRAIREAHPGWGARLIRRQLRLDGVAPIPCERTIEHWLARMGYPSVRPVRHKPLGWQPPEPEPSATTWEADHKQKGGPRI